MLALSKYCIIMGICALSVILILGIMFYGSDTTIRVEILKSLSEITESTHHPGNETSYKGNSTTTKNTDLLKQRPSTTTAISIPDPIEELIATGKRYVLHNFGSGLGNHMFQYAFLRSTAEKFNATAILPDDILLLLGFKLDALIVKSDLFNKLAERYKNVTRYPERACAYDPKIFKGMFRDRQFEVSQGAMESLRYFEKQEKLIRREFTFRPEILERARRRLEEARDAMMVSFGKDFHNATYIGVHVRHGDVATQAIMDIGLVPATNEYIYHALDYFRAKYKNAFFVVATDDIPWVAEVVNATQKGDIYLLPFEIAEVDMATLVLCNHTLATTGTYSWWIGYLVNGETVFYKNWPRKGSFAEEQFERKDYFPKNWVFME